VRAARDRAQAAQSAMQLARAQQSNDITWGGSVDHYPTANGVTLRQMELRLQMPLQWGYRFEGEIGRASALQSQSQDLLERVRWGARAELQTLLQAWDAARERLQTYERDILPRAQRVAQQAELAYTQGALTLTDLLDARRTLRTTRLEAIAAQADFAKAQGTWQLRTQLITP
ncbi:MAG: TolC family protein, partial [Limnohabitans sp.]